MVSTSVSNNAYQLALQVEFRKNIWITLLVEFGTNTLALLVYFFVLVVANHMRFLGAQTADGKQSRTLLVYFITNTYQLASIIESRKISDLLCSYSLV